METERVRVGDLRPGDVGPWGSTVLSVKVSHRDRHRRIVVWTGGEGAGLRGRAPEDRRVEVYAADRTLTVTHRGPCRLFA